MARRVKVTVLSPSPNGGEYHEVIEVADDFELPPMSDKDDWITIEGSDGSEWAFPPRLVVGVVLEAKQKKARRGGRLN